MANNPKFLLAACNAMADALNVSVGASAIFAIYAGTQPATVGAATTGANVTVAYLTMTESSAFAAATNRAIAANAITSDSSAAGGTAAWFSIQKSTGARVMDGEVGTSGSDLNLNSTTITTGATVAISSFTVTVGS